MQKIGDMVGKKKDMVWNVYEHDFNAKEIVVFNVFDHWHFHEDVLKLLKNKKLTYEEFAEQLRKDAQYYFWSKCEWEVIITSFPTHITKKEWERLKSEECNYRCGVNLDVEKKIDVYDQLRFNWSSFVDYVWGFRSKPVSKPESAVVEYYNHNANEEAAEAWNTRYERTCIFMNDEYFSWGAVMCGGCGEHWFPENDKSRFKFCPNCGAKVVNNED